MSSHCSKRSHRSRYDESGVSMLELAIFLVLLLILSMGFVDLTYIFVQHSRIANATRDIGRSAAAMDEECWTNAYDTLKQRLNDMGYHDSQISLSGGITDDATYQATMLTLVVNVDIAALTSALTYGDHVPMLNFNRTYQFPIEHPNYCPAP